MTQIQQAILAEIRKQAPITVILDKPSFQCMCIRIGCPGAINANGAWSYSSFSSSETIWINIDLANPYSTATIFHELAHATKIPNRLNREYRVESGHTEECIAERTAEILMEYFKLATDATRATSDTYIFRHSLSGDVDMRVVDREARLAADYILENWLPDLNRSIAKEAV